ncbi:MAG: hypothetical protein U0350_39010 [Caldilineaceae bacterium]
MGTYNHKQVLSDYETGKLDVEMAMGHALQHIDKLYEAQSTANTESRVLQQTVSTLQNEMKTYQAQTSGLPKLQAALVRLQRLVDSLITHTGMPLPTSKKKPPQPS